MMRQIIDTFLTQKVEMSRFERLMFRNTGYGRVRNGKSLIASLYSIREGANPEIIAAVKSIVVDIKKEMSESDILLLQDNLPEVVKYCYNDDMTSSRVEVLTQDYIDLISGISNFSTTERILLPLGEICIAAAFPQCKFDIVETSKLGWGIAHIISSILELDTRIYKSLESLPLKEYSKIIALGSQTINYERQNLDLLISCLENNLKEEEDMILLLPRHACYSKDWEKLREFLAQNPKKYLTVCLSLNIEQKYTVFGDECLMVITKNSPSPIQKKWDSIILGDFTGTEFMFSDPVSGCPTGLRVQSIIESITKGDHDHIRFVDANKLDRCYNFLAARYFREEALLMKPEKAKMLTTLSDIIQIYQPLNFIEKLISSVENEDKIKVISPKNLSETHLACNINFSKIPSIEMDEANISATIANGGYYSFYNNKALVGKILGGKEDIVGISDGIIHFEIKDNSRCILDYILKELTEDYAVEQARCFIKGLEIGGDLSIEDFLSIQIVLPSLNEQNEILRKEGEKGFSHLEREREATLKEFKEDMHMKKHAIGQTIFAVNNWMKLLSLARKEGNGAICDTDVIGKRHPVTVAEIFDNLEASMKRLKTQISTMDTGSQFTPTQIGVGSFIKNYISTHPRSEFQYVDLTNALATHDLPAINEESGNFEVSDNDFILRKGDDLYFINFPEEALTIILDNIISNACSHGFKDDGKDYYIRFIIDVSGKDLTLIVSNNGEPLHKELDANGVFKYGNTTGNSLDGHYGIGGYEIWKLMKDFNGTTEILSTPDLNFTVSYKLTFPLFNYVKHF